MKRLINPEEITNDQFIGIEQFLLSCTVPIIAENESTAGVHGTGVLFAVDNYHCIITAAHVADYFEDYPNSLGIPANRFSLSSQVLTLKDCQVVSPKSKKDKSTYDLAVVLLDQNPDLLDYLLKNNNFLSLQNLINYKQPVKDYLISGYPQEMTKVINRGVPRKNLVIGDLFNFITDTYNGPFESNIKLNPPHDIFLSHDEDIISNKGETISSPKLEGISGSAIWAFDNCSNIESVWSPEKTIKIAGFQYSYLPNKWIRGIKLYALVHTFGHIDKKVKDKITIQLGFNPEI